MIEMIFYVLMEVILYGTGRAVIWIISLGRARAVNIKEIFQGKFTAYDGETGKMLVPAWAATIMGALTLWGVLMLSLTWSR